MRFNVGSIYKTRYKKKPQSSKLSRISQWSWKLARWPRLQRWNSHYKSTECTVTLLMSKKLPSAEKEPRSKRGVEIFQFWTKDCEAKWRRMWSPATEYIDDLLRKFEWIVRRWKREGEDEEKVWERKGETFPGTGKRGVRWNYSRGESRPITYQPWGRRFDSLLNEYVQRSSKGGECQHRWYIMCLWDVSQGLPHKIWRSRGSIFYRYSSRLSAFKSFHKAAICGVFSFFLYLVDEMGWKRDEGPCKLPQKSCNCKIMLVGWTYIRNSLFGELTRTRPWRDIDSLTCLNRHGNLEVWIMLTVTSKLLIVLGYQNSFEH